jgi:hypothetical protein
VGGQQEEFQMDQERSLHIFRRYLQLTNLNRRLGPVGRFRLLEVSSTFAITTMTEEVKSFG